MFDLHTDCLLNVMYASAQLSNICLTQNVEKILQVNLHRMIYFCTLTIVYFEFDVFEQI